MRWRIDGAQHLLRDGLCCRAILPERMNIDHRLHYLALTAIIRKGDKYLICRRASAESVYGGKWCVPGGKLEHQDIYGTPADLPAHWTNELERALKREVREETGLEITNIRPVRDLALRMRNGYPMVILSMCADWGAGEVRLAPRELIAHAWVTAREARAYDLIDDIADQIELADRRYWPALARTDS